MALVVWTEIVQQNSSFCSDLESEQKLCVCVCVCVCERERERDTHTHTEHNKSLNGLKQAMHFLH